MTFFYSEVNPSQSRGAGGTQHRGLRQVAIFAYRNGRKRLTLALIRLRPVIWEKSCRESVLLSRCSREEELTSHQWNKEGMQMVCSHVSGMACPCSEGLTRWDQSIQLQYDIKLIISLCGIAIVRNDVSQTNLLAYSIQQCSLCLSE